MILTLAQINEYERPYQAPLQPTGSGFFLKLLRTSPPMAFIRSSISEKTIPARVGVTKIASGKKPLILHVPFDKEIIPNLPDADVF